MVMPGPVPPVTPVTRVLIVDDDTRVREMLARVLTVGGYAVTEAGGTDAALDILARDGEMPLIISDLNMPVRDGRELLREVRSRYPDTAVVMLTGNDDVATAVECLKIGASDYLSKPVQVQEVRARIEKALAERNLTLEVRRLRDSYHRDLEHQVRELSRKNQAMFLAQVQMAVTMLEAKDPYTRGHSGRVAGLRRGHGACDGVVAIAGRAAPAWRRAARHRQDWHARRRAQQAGQPDRG